MEAKPNRSIPIQLTVQVDEARLLQGLQVWQELGLLTDDQIRQISQTHLTCSLPEVQTIALHSITPASVVEPPAGEELESQMAMIEANSALQSVSSPTAIGQRWQRLMAEISVIWLLFLGVFLVVVSSGVLAASQWQNFSPIGQYAVLFGYTLLFGLASVWTGRSPHLRLTSQMLRAATLLIIPINFWMMDAVRIWQQPWGIPIALIAALSLVAVFVQVLRGETISPSSRWFLLTNIGLSALHWGWSWSVMPLIATYLGTAAVTALLLWQQRQSYPASLQAGTPTSDAAAALDSPVATLTVIVSALLLSIRAVWVAEVPLSQLGLAIGISGWLICRLSRQGPIRFLGLRTGAALLLLGWIVALEHEPPWQAMIVSVLAAWLLFERLQRSHQLYDQTGLFLVGLQTLWLLSQLVPQPIQERFVEFCLAIGLASWHPTLGVTLFPYVMFMIWVGYRWRQHQQETLAYHAEWLALILGIVLTLWSFPAAITRSPNLTLSTLTLAFVLQRRTTQPPALIYLTQALGLGAIVSWINWSFPDLPSFVWAALLIGLCAAEWGICLRLSSLERSLWQDSSWRCGLILAGLSYIVLLGESWWNGSDRGWLWLLIPLMLTGLSYHRALPRPEAAIGFSTISLLIAQLLTLSFPLPRLLGLAVATGLLPFNMQRLPRLLTALLTVGFALFLATEVLWQLLGNRLSMIQWLNGWIIVAGGLWFLWSFLRDRNVLQLRLYARAAHAWAVLITVLSGLILTGYSLFLYSTATPAQSLWLLASALAVAASSVRVWHKPDALGFFLIAWCIEIGVAIALTQMIPPEDWVTALAIANLVLAALTQLGSDFWVRQIPRPARPSWHIIPLFYAGLGGLLAHSNFTATTGLYTAATALIAIGVGRRTPRLRLLLYAALVLFTYAAYELLVYHLLQTPKAAGDGVTALAALAAGLALSYRLGQRWLVSSLRLPAQPISAIAHLHWVLGAGQLIAALLNERSHIGGWLWIGTAIVMAGYALGVGRTQQNWIYPGIVTAIFALFYASYLVVPENLLLPWAGAIAAGLSLVLHESPWQRWGWSLPPWQNCALILPGLVLLLTMNAANLPALLLVAAFYARLAQARSQIRLSYVSLFLADYALLRWLLFRAVTEPFWYSAVMGLSLLYVAQVDPAMRSPSDREKRHLLRCLSTGLISLTTIFQSETSWVAILLTFGFSLLLILSGLTLRIRAFLFVGTATFIFQVLRQVWLWVSTDSLLIWAIGILLGLAFIWIAATFESRRSQVNTLMQQWITELEQWE